jgi:probable HAF family extracellular repeat protein
MRTRACTLIAAAAMVAPGLCGAAAHAQTYHVRDLGSLGGLGDTDAFDVAGVTPMVVGFATSASQNHRAFVWDGSTLVQIDPLGTDTQSGAIGVDGLGRIVGNSYTLGEPAVHAWRRDQGVTSLLGSFSARGVNPSGAVVGFLGVTDSWGLHQDHACLLGDGEVAPTDLGTLAGASWSRAYAINSSGQIVGESAGANDQGTRPVLWRQGVAIDLGTLGGAYGGASAINDTGVVVGWSDAGGTTPANRATKFVLDVNGQVVSRVNLGTLPTLVPGAGAWSYAFGVNNSGLIVGQSNGRGIVDFGQGINDLNALVPASPAWLIVTARSIDENGQIAAWGVDSIGRPRPLLLAPCDGDYNRDGVLSVSDIFDYLNGWFAGDTRADTLRNGVLSVQDIFEFLMRWFAGCQF